MANFGLGNEIRELKIGQSFTNPKSTAFHSIKYDFKPASVNGNKAASLEVSNNNQVTVTIPQHDGPGTSNTVFKGSQKPYSKECVLIIDKNTGEIILEKLSSNIQLKKTRSEKPIDRSDKSPFGSLNMPKAQTSPVGQRTSSKTKVTSGSRKAERHITHLVPKHSPLQASPNYPSPKRDREVAGAHNDNPNALASLPMIGLDDFSDSYAPAAAVSAPARAEKSPIFTQSDIDDRVEEMSDSSSSSSSSDSDSDLDATVINKNLGKTSGHTNGSNSTQKLAQEHILTEDLCLSESGSDSE